MRIPYRNIYHNQRRTWENFPKHKGGWREGLARNDSGYIRQLFSQTLTAALGPGEKGVREGVGNLGNAIYCTTFPPPSADPNRHAMFRLGSVGKADWTDLSEPK